MSAIRHVEVVIPAQDEQERIGDCVGSVSAAVDAMRSERPEISCGITVVLDCCTDDTGAVALEFGARLLSSDACQVGAARQAGTADAIDRAAASGIDASALWIACTDADTVVPRHWLSRQIEFAGEGNDAVIGTVTPTDVSPEVYRRWLREHDLTEGHSHVHGANLGFTADVYLRAGGFQQSESREDVGLVERIRVLTSRWVATHETSVRTSGRTESRVQGGFASFLGELSAEAT